MARLLLVVLTCLFPFWSLAQTQPVPLADTLTQPLTTYRYVNATALTLRTKPEATAPASGIIAGASRVEVMAELADDWSQVRLGGQKGYVRSAYLVETQDLVTAEVDWASMEAAGGAGYSSMAAVPAARKINAKPAIGPKVYICGNGRTEVYHRSENCAAMRRCTYQSLIMSQREAKASGLRECMKCY